MNTVIAALNMNVPVATSDRIESRGSPHTPWPEVQPFPVTVPTPTSRPAMSSTIGLWVMVIAGKSPVKMRASNGETTTPRTNMMRQCQSVATGGSSRLTIPLMPMIWPCEAMSKTAAAPIITPPMRASTKSCIN